MTGTGIFYSPQQFSSSKGDPDGAAKPAERSLAAREGAHSDSAQPGDMRSFYTLSRNLVATNTIDVLLDNIVRYTVEILKVEFAKVLTLEASGQFMCAASCYANDAPRLHKKGRPEARAAQPIYQRVMRAKMPSLLETSDATLTAREKQALGLLSSRKLCLVPLRVDADLIGILAIGDDQPNRQPFEEDMLHMASMIGEQAASAIHRARLRHRLQESSLNTVLALAKTIEAHDPYTGGHGRKLTRLAEETARLMGFSEMDLQTIRWAALLHDIGKISIAADVLTRAGPLSDNEWQLMRQHPQIGAEIVLMVSELADVAAFIRAHHERFDGSGYPYGLKKDEIPLGARILAVIDAYSAMTDGRVYRAARTHSEAVEELRRCAGRDFDPRVVQAFLKIFEMGKVAEISQD